MKVYTEGDSLISLIIFVVVTLCQHRAEPILHPTVKLVNEPSVTPEQILPAHSHIHPAVSVKHSIWSTSVCLQGHINDNYEALSMLVNMPPYNPCHRVKKQR